MEDNNDDDDNRLSRNEEGDQASPVQQVKCNDDDMTDL